MEVDAICTEIDSSRVVDVDYIGVITLKGGQYSSREFTLQGFGRVETETKFSGVAFELLIVDEWDIVHGVFGR